MPQFNAPPGWPEPPTGWQPPPGWAPDPAWPPPPPGWLFWVIEEPISIPERSAVDDDAVLSLEHPPPTLQPTTDVTPPSTAEAAEESGQTPSALVAEPSATRPRNEPDVEPPTARNSANTAERHPAPGPDALDTSPRPSQPAELPALERAIEQARQELKDARRELASARAELVELNDAIVLQQVGIYEYHHPLENAEAYRGRLTDLQQAMKDAVRQGQAVLASNMFSYNNSLAAGRRMVADFSKLMLRAYNSEADAARRSLRAGNVVTAKTRLDNAAATIAKLGSMMEMRIAPGYHKLRSDELELTADYLMKVQEEREAAREERERLREEQKAQAELLRQREQLTKQREQYLATLQTLTLQGRDETEVERMRQRVADVDAAIAANENRAANIRVGTVYVISNVGAFGPSVVKIGLTRRLDPMERIRELGDASVPFPFDVHAKFFSDDAVTLETELHKAFAHRRVNSVNLRREFFFATPAEVREVLASKVGTLLEFVEEPEAVQFLQSRPDRPTATRNLNGHDEYELTQENSVRSFPRQEAGTES